MAKPIVGYWDIRGLAQPIRSLLAYAGVDFEDKRYLRTQADGKGSEWHKEKFQLGFEFPNLPYLIDGDIKLTQSVAILRYLARKYHLEGATEMEKTRIDVLEQQVADINVNFFIKLSNEEYEKVQADYDSILPDQLQLLSNFVGSSKFAVGNSVTYVDFMLYEYLIKIKLFAPKVFGQFDNLQQFVDNVESLPKLAEWFKMKGPQKMSWEWIAEY